MKSNYIGYLFIYSWCIISAFSMLLTSEVSQQLSPFIVSFFTFLLATCIFNLCNAAKLKTLWKSIKSRQITRQIIGINISSFVSWGLMIYPLTYLQPTLVVTLILGINPLATAVIARFFLKKETSQNLMGTSIGLFLVIIYLSYQTLQGENSITGSSSSQTIISLICCYFSGIATSVNNVINKNIMEKGFGILDVFCLRFYLTIIISGLIGFSTATIIFNAHMLVSITSTTLVFVIIPLVLLQIALKNLDPLQIAIISPLMPVLVVVLQLLGDINILNYSTILSTILTWLLVSFGTYSAIKQSSIKSRSYANEKTLS